MTTVDCSTGVFCRVDEARADRPKHPQAKLYPREVVTMALLCALKGGAERAFDRWLERAYRPLFPPRPARTRLVRLCATHQDWTARFLAPPTLVGGADRYGVAVLHPDRAQRGPRSGRLGRKGFSKHRWIVGGKRGSVLTKWGLVGAWGAATATVPDRAFPPLIARFATPMVVRADDHCARREGTPAHLTVGPRGTGNERLRVQTFFALRTLVCHATHALQRVWRSFTRRVACTVALVTILVHWHGLPVDEHGCAHRSIAHFSL